jgi:tetratricopeptide (TPR) repeat protein
MTSMMPPPGDAVPVLPTDAGQVDPQIVAARQAAANQQHQEAISIYRGYISRNASDPSAFGELGNVLLAAGRPQEAAQAYYEASSRLIDVGQPGTVYLLLPHIEQHDPLLGAVLMRRLASLPRSIY